MVRVRREVTRPGPVKRSLQAELNSFAAMASVVTPLDQPSNYKDSQARLDRQKQHELHQKSTTLYVSSLSIQSPLCTSHPPQIGNLSFYTTEEQIHDVFSKCANPEDGGGVKRIIMGLDRHTRYATFGYK